MTAAMMQCFPKEKPKRKPASYVHTVAGCCRRGQSPPGVKPTGETDHGNQAHPSPGEGSDAGKQLGTDEVEEGLQGGAASKSGQ